MCKRVGSDILQITNSPDFRKILVYVKQGELHSYPIEPAKESGRKFGQEDAISCVQFNEGLVTGLACMTLTGKAAVSI